jgi:hypothetical protein
MHEFEMVRWTMAGPETNRPVDRLNELSAAGWELVGDGWHSHGQWHYALLRRALEATPGAPGSTQTADLPPPRIGVPEGHVRVTCSACGGVTGVTRMEAVRAALGPVELGDLMVLCRQCMERP